MIKLEHVVLASPEQMEFIIQGMRNPMNSWDKSDSDNSIFGFGFKLGENDHSLMQRLAKAGTDHRKFMRMMPVYVRITAPLYWWKEFDTYKVGTVANSCSTMHKIQEKEFTLEDFSIEYLLGFDGPHNDEREVPYVPIDHDDISPLGLYKCGIIPMLNLCREKYLEINRDLYLEREKALNMNASEPMADLKELKKKQKDIWWQMIQLLPSSYNQTRNVMLNYEVLANIYKSRKNHKLDCWRDFCAWIESLPYSELICGNDALMTPNEQREMMGLPIIGVDLEAKEYTPQEYAKENPEWVDKIEKKLDEVNSNGDKEEIIGSMNTSKQNEEWV